MRSVQLPERDRMESLSDVNMKEHFRHLYGGRVLAKIARMPIRGWSYAHAHPAENRLEDTQAHESEMAAERKEKRR